MMLSMEHRIEIDITGYQDKESIQIYVDGLILMARRDIAKWAEENGLLINMVTSKVNIQMEEDRTSWFVWEAWAHDTERYSAAFGALLISEGGGSKKKPSDDKPEADDDEDQNVEP